MNWLKATFLCWVLVTGAALADEISVEKVVVPEIVAGGESAQGFVRLTEAASDNDTWVELRSHGPVHVPAALRVPKGQRSVTFVLHTDPVQTSVQVEVWSALDGQSSGTETLVLNEQAVTVR